MLHISLPSIKLPAHVTTFNLLAGRIVFMTPLRLRLPRLHCLLDHY